MRNWTEMTLPPRSTRPRLLALQPRAPFDVNDLLSPSVKIVVASSNWSSNLPWGDGFYDDEIHQREERARAQPNERAA